MAHPEPRRSPTLREVAARADVALSTASRALNGDRTVAEALAVRVQAAAESLGYSANLAARAMRTRQDVVALLASDIGTEAVGQIAAGLEAGAHSGGAVATVSSAGGDPKAQLAALAALRELRPRALVLTGAWLADASTAADLHREIRDFVLDGGRVVIVGTPIEGLPAVGFDDYGAGRVLADHMVAAAGGHRAIILAGGREHHAFMDRTRGYGEGLRDGGVRDIRVLHTPVTRRDAERALSAALDDYSADLVLAGNDRMALGALRSARSRGMKVPDEIALCGVDDIAIARDTLPSLTTVAFPFFRAGAEAARVALSSAQSSPERVLLQGELIVRASSRRAG